MHTMLAMLAMMATMAGRAAGATGCDDILVSLGNAGEKARWNKNTGNSDSILCDGYASECDIYCNPGFELYNSESNCVRGHSNYGSDDCFDGFECIGDGGGSRTWTPLNNAVYCRRICGTQTNEQTRLTGASATDPGTCAPCTDGTWAAANADNCVPHTECPDGYIRKFEGIATTSDATCIEIQCTAGSDEIYKRWGCNVSTPTATTISELGTISNLPGHSCFIEPCASQNSDFEVYSKCAIGYHVNNGTCVACEFGTHNDDENTLGGIYITVSANMACLPNMCRDNKTTTEWSDLGCSGSSLGGNSMNDWDSILEQEVYMLTPYVPADGYATCDITCPQNVGEFAVTATCAADYHVQAGKCAACTGGATRDEGDGTANGDTHCSCGTGMFAATNTAVCAPHKECISSTEYESVAPTATSDRACAAVMAECPVGQSESAAPTSTSNRACDENVCTARTDNYYRSFGCIVQNATATTISGLGNFSSVTGYVCSIQPCETPGNVFPLFYSCAENYRVNDRKCVACEDGTHNAEGDAFYNSADTTCDDNVCTQKTLIDWTGFGCKDILAPTSDAISAGETATVVNLGSYGPAEGYKTCAITCPENNGEFAVSATCNAQTHYTHSVTTAAQACTEFTVCAAETHYESVAPTSTSDRGCEEVASNCIAGQYESVAPTATSDRECEECKSFNDACAECSAVSVCTKCSGKTHLAPPGPYGEVGCDDNPTCHAEINQDNCTAYTNRGLGYSLEPDSYRCTAVECTVEECCTPNRGCDWHSTVCGEADIFFRKYAIGNAEGGFVQCSGLDSTSCNSAECCIDDAPGGFVAAVVDITGYLITVDVPSGELKPEQGGTVRYVDGATISTVGIVSVTPTSSASASRARRADVEFIVGVDGNIPTDTKRVEFRRKPQSTRKSKKTKKAKKANSTVTWVVGGVFVVAVVVVVVIRNSHKDDYPTRLNNANLKIMTPSSASYQRV